MNNTEHYNLNKPGMMEVADINILNANMDTVDNVMYQNEQAAAAANSAVETAQSDISTLNADMAAVKSDVADLDTKSTYKILTFTTDLNLDDYVEPGLYYVENTNNINPGGWGGYNFPDYNLFQPETISFLPFLFKVEVLYEKDDGEKGVVQYISPSRGHIFRLGEWAYHRYGERSSGSTHVLFYDWRRDSLLGFDTEIEHQGDISDISLAKNGTWDGEHTSLKDTIASTNSKIINIVANPVESPVSELNTIKIGDIVYKLPTGSITTSTNANITVLSSSTSVGEQGRVEEE